MDDYGIQWVGTGYRFLSEKERRALYNSGGTKGGLKLWTGLNAVLVECVGKGITSMGYDILGTLTPTRIGIKQSSFSDEDEQVLEIPYIYVPIVLSTEEVVDRVTRIKPYLKEGFEWREEAGGIYSPTIDFMLQEKHTDIFKMYDSSAKRFHHDGLLRLQSWALTEVQKVTENPAIKKSDLETAIGNPPEYYRKIASWNITAEEICRVLALANTSTTQTTREEPKREEQPTGQERQITRTGFGRVMKTFFGIEV